MKEEEGDVTEAANVIQELQVETYGSMEKREKVFLFTIIFSVLLILLAILLYSNCWIYRLN